MSEDIIKTRGTMKNYQDDRGGATLITVPVLGIVKNNIDPTRSGRIQVYLKRLNTPDQDNPKTWTTVSYLSPFFGTVGNTNSPDNAGTFVGNPQSYGFWATPPDLNTEVLCVFLNGDPSFGYYIGCIPQAGLMHMVPALGSSDNILTNNDAESDNYGGATRLPVTEINDANRAQNNSDKLIKQPRPVHTFQASILNTQGLLRDPDRGTIGSSSSRESPSRVFGISTPGRPIYKGGYDDKTITAAVTDKTIPDKNFSVIGRTGGHSIVLDDGDLTGKDQLMRFRTTMGHQILLNDSAQTLFIIHANGQSYIELGKEGTIDMYSTNSVNIRTQGDLNLHADNNININAMKDLNISAENIRMESSKETTSFVGTTFKNYTKGEFTVKVDTKMSLASGGDASVASKGTTYINGGPNVNLNTGSSSLVPAEVKQLSQVAHTDTLHDAKKGYAAAPGKLQSIVSRAPAHSPWASANQGVDVKTNMSSSANLPAEPSSSITKINSAVPSTPSNATTPALTSTVSNVSAANEQIDKVTTGAMISQIAVNSANGIGKDISGAGAGIVNVNGTKVAVVGEMCLNPTQLVESGHLKPYSDIAINSIIASGKSLEQAMAPNFFTGKDGVKNLTNLVNNPTAQASAAVSLIEKSATGLTAAGLITGKESPTQVAGLVMSGATAGLEKTVDFAKSIAGGTNPLANNPLVAASASKFGAIAGGVGGIIAAGNFAAKLADKALGPLSGLSLASVTDQVKGIAAGAFSKVTASFKALKTGVAQNLSVIKEQNAAMASAEDAGKVATDVLGNLPSANSLLPSGLLGNTTAVLAQASSLSNIATKVAGFSPSGLSGLPGGSESVLNSVNLGGSNPLIAQSAATFAGVNKLASSIPGVGDLSKTISSVTGAIGGDISGATGAINGLKNKLSSGLPDLQALASTGLGPGALAKLNSSLNSLGDIKLPTIATGTFDKSELIARAKELNGNPLIPSTIKLPDSTDQA